MMLSLIALKLLIFTKSVSVSDREILLFQGTGNNGALHSECKDNYCFASVVDDIHKKIEEEQAKTEFLDDDIERILKRNRWLFMSVFPMFIWVAYLSLKSPD
jgi:hypothetical protein